MDQSSNKKPQYDLEERTFLFARDVRVFIKTLPYSKANEEDGKQLIRSSGSVGANYIEANEALGKKDFLMRVRICRKEAKESAYWLRLILSTNVLDETEEGERLRDEATQFKKIYHSILQNSQR